VSEDQKYLMVSNQAVDDGELVGKPPSEVSLEDLKALGHPQSLTKAVRAKCLDCAHHESEVRKCVQYSCPLWPFRMGKSPFHKRSKHNKETNNV